MFMLFYFEILVVGRFLRKYRVRLDQWRLQLAQGVLGLVGMTGSFKKVFLKTYFSPKFSWGLIHALGLGLNFY